MEGITDATNKFVLTSTLGSATIISGVSMFTQAGPWLNTYITGVEVTTENGGVTTSCANLNSWNQSQVYR